MIDPIVKNDDTLSSKMIDPIVKNDDTLSSKMIDPIIKNDDTLSSKMIDPIIKNDDTKINLLNTTLLNINPLNTTLLNIPPIKDTGTQERERIKSKSKSNNIDLIIKESFKNKEVVTTFYEFLDYRKKMGKPLVGNIMKKVINNLNNYPDNDKIKMLDTSMINGWKDIYPLKKQSNNYNGNKSSNNNSKYEYIYDQPEF